MNASMNIQGNGRPVFTNLANAGVFGEYTYHYGETVSVIAGLIIAACMGERLSGGD